MKKFTKFAGLMFVAAVMTFSFASESQAVPAFARQTGNACTTCHFQQFPLLNAFGRAFVRGGYTMVGGQSLIEGDDLSIPATLNATLITQIQYVKTNGDSDPAAGSDNGEIKFPNEAALFLGGRVGEHIGFVLESQIGEADANGFTNFKMPFGFDAGVAHLEVAPFTTDGFGPSYGFELLNTGAVRQPRPTEHRSDVSAQQYVGMTGAATGFAFVASNEMGFVNATLYVPGTESADMGTSFLNYFRVAATPQVAGWDLGIGAQLMTGTSKAEGYTGVDWNDDGDMLDRGEGNNEVKANAMAFDAQAQGMVGSMPLGVYLSYAVVPKSDTTGAHNVYNSGTKKDKSAIGISALLSVTPKTEISVGTRQGTNNAGDSDNAIALGVKYLIAQNVQLSLNHSIYSGDANDDPSSAAGDWDGDQKSTLMLFSAF